eukprot:8371116-Pyramimonas_sp.AAC.1
MGRDPSKPPQKQNRRRRHPQEPSTRVLKLTWRKTQPCAVVGTAAACTAFGGAPDGTTMRVWGVPRWVRWTHVNADI